MSTNSNDHGRAYEYAWINTLYRTLAAIRKHELLAILALMQTKGHGIC